MNANNLCLSAPTLTCTQSLVGGGTKPTTGNLHSALGDIQDPEQQNSQAEMFTLD